MRGIGFVTAVALAVGAPGAMAASPQHHHRTSALGGSCRGSASAIAQYCEVIPTPGGGQHPGPGTPTLLSVLPSGAVRRLAPLPTRRLLRIPAAAIAPPGVRGLGTPGAGAGISAGGADSAALWAPMVLILALIALIMGGVAIVRRRRLSEPLG